MFVNLILVSTSYSRVKYERLDQDDNEEEDDDVMFSREGISSKVLNQDDVVVNGNHIQLERATLMKNPDYSVVQVHNSSLYKKTRNFCFLAVIVFCVVTALFLWLVLPSLRAWASSQTAIASKRTPPWEKSLYNYSKHI